MLQISELELSDLATLLLNKKDEIAAKAVDLHYDADESLNEKYNESGKEKYFQDNTYHLLYLAEAVRFNSVSLFTEYLSWAKVLLKSLDIPESIFIDTLKHLRSAIKNTLPKEEGKSIVKFLSKSIKEFPRLKDSIPSFLLRDNPYFEEASHYLNLLLSYNKSGASNYILDLSKSEMDLKDLYIHVFQPVQYEVGRLWQMNKISVAQEHYCTAASQLIMAQLYPQIFNKAKNGKRFVGISIAQELHDIGIRMICDLLELEGWDTIYLGGNIPSPSVLKIIDERKPDVLGISAAIAFHLNEAADLIKSVKEKYPKVKVVVGGYAFSKDKELWKSIGADAYSINAANAVKIIEKISG